MSVVKSITLYFNQATSVQVPIYISSPVKKLVIKQLGVVNDATSVPGTYSLANLRTDLVKGPSDQSLCLVTLVPSASYVIPLGVEFEPINSNINNTFTFQLVYSNQAAIDGNIKAFVNLLVEFIY